ncbi:MAG: hypothetical protein JWO37_579 [Acidimicrobiales bacterium]|jgi:hypothetical protein|nr:hypothetical protein [Acidimicrobiales bacterium]
MIERPPARAWVLVLTGMATYGVIAYVDPVWARWRRVDRWLPRPVYRAGFLLAAGTHVYKAGIASGICAEAGRPKGERRAWTAQTLALGFPSLRLLRGAQHH